MGYDAFVRCNCWKEGKTKPYPFDYGFHFDNRDGMLEVNMPLTDPEHEQKFMDVSIWMEDCCEHSDMKILWLRVANQSGMISFKDALEQLGWEYFPTLKEELPVYNEGSVTPEKAVMMLNELAQFLEITSSTQNAMLVNTETGETVQSYLASREGVFLHDLYGGVDIGVDPQGFFIANRHEFYNPRFDAHAMSYRVQRPRLDLFRAMRFEQRGAIDGEREGIKFVDLDTGETYLLHHSDGIPKDEAQNSLHTGIVELLYNGQSTRLSSLLRDVQQPTFHVEVRPRDPYEFHHIIQALMDLCNASEETGNPIYWQ